MNVKVKNPQAPSLINQLISDRDTIEFIGYKPTKSVYFLRGGTTYKFNQLNPQHYVLLHRAYMMDAMAKLHICKLAPGNINRQVELYTYFNYGAIDSTADIINGVLQPNENFRHDRDCISLRFTSKKMRIDGKPLTQRELQIIDLIYRDYPDKMISQELGIAKATLTTHKGKLFRKINVASKVGLIRKAVEQQIPMV